MTPAFDLARALAEAPVDGRVLLPPGSYSGAFLIDRPVTVVAMGPAVISGAHLSSIFTIQTEGTVRLSGLTLVEGRAAEAGGALNVRLGTVEVSDCIFRFNEAPGIGGGAVSVRDAKVTLTRCRCEGNRARFGGAVLATGSSLVRFIDCAIIQNAAGVGGGVFAEDGATVELSGCTLADNRALGGSTTGHAVTSDLAGFRPAVVRINTSIVADRSRSALLEGAVELVDCLLPLSSPVMANEVNVLRGEPGFVWRGSEPYVIEAGSLAARRVDASTLSGRRDVLGKPRTSQARGDWGAFNALPPKPALEP